MSKRLSCRILGVALICFCTSSLASAASFTLSQSELWAADFDLYAGSIYGVTSFQRQVSGNGVLYHFGFNAGVAGLTQRSLVNEDNLYVPYGVDLANPTLVAETWPYSAGRFEVLTGAGFIAYPLNSKNQNGLGWSGAADVTLLVEPTPGVTPLNFNYGFALAPGDVLSLKFTLISITGFTLSPGERLGVGTIAMATTTKAPEPVSAAFLLTGLVGVGLLRRRRRSA